MENSTSAPQTTSGATYNYLNQRGAANPLIERLREDILRMQGLFKAFNKSKINDLRIIMTYICIGKLEHARRIGKI